MGGYNIGCYFRSVLPWELFILVIISDLSCPESFRCKNGRCIPFTAVCDGKDQCQDFSDEDGCGKVLTSNSHLFLIYMTSMFWMAGLVIIIQYIVVFDILTGTVDYA